MEKCLFSLCFSTLSRIDYSFLVELPAITRFNADDKVANLRWLHLFKMHYIPLCWLACHQFYRTFFMIALETYWQCLAAFIFNFPFSFSGIDAGYKQHILCLQLMQITSSMMLCVIQQLCVLKDCSRTQSGGFSFFFFSRISWWLSELINWRLLFWTVGFRAAAVFCCCLWQTLTWADSDTFWSHFTSNYNDN